MVQWLLGISYEDTNSLNNDVPYLYTKLEKSREIFGIYRWETPKKLVERKIDCGFIGENSN